MAGRPNAAAAEPSFIDELQADTRGGGWLGEGGVGEAPGGAACVSSLGKGIFWLLLCLAGVFREVGHHKCTGNDFNQVILTCKPAHAHSSTAGQLFFTLLLLALLHFCLPFAHYVRLSSSFRLSFFRVTVRNTDTVWEVPVRA